jgi:hypothetical protein
MSVTVSEIEPLVVPAPLRSADLSMRDDAVIPCGHTATSTQGASRLATATASLSTLTLRSLARPEACRRALINVIARRN